MALFDTLRANAVAAMEAGQLEHAVANLEQLRAASPADIAGYLLGVEALWRLNRHAEAETLADAALRSFPDSLPAAHVYARTATQRGDPGAAAQRWARVRERFPGDPGGYANGAAALMELGRLDEAEDLLDWLVQNRPEFPDGWIGQGTLAMRRRAWEAAETCWRAVRDRFAKMPVGYGCGAETLAMLGRLDEADALGRAAMARFPDNMWLAHVYAALAARRHDAAGAADRWAQVRAAFPGDPAGYEIGARALRELNRTEEAATVLAQAVLRFPHRMDAFTGMAELAMERGGWAQAALLWAELRRRFPSEVKGYLQGALALRRAGLPAAADALAAEAGARFTDSLDLALMQLEAQLDASLAPDVWELWCRCERLGGRTVPHFFTLSFRVYLLLHDQPRAGAVLAVLLGEPVGPEPDAVPSLVRGLAWCLQSGDARFAAVHGAIALHLGHASGQDLAPVMRILLGLGAPDAVAALVRERLAALPSKLTQVLFSSFEGHQATAAAAQSGIGAALRAALPGVLAEIGSDAVIPTAELAFNTLLYAFALDAALFRTAAGILHAFLQQTAAPAGPPGIWAAVGTICRAAAAALTSPPARRHRSPRLRIALCVSGQLRGFRTARDTWDRLGLDRHDLTTVVHVWRNVGRLEMALANEQRGGFPRSFVQRYNPLVLQVGLQTMRARFPRFYAAFTGRSEVTEAELRDVYRTDHVVVEDDGAEPFSALTNPMKMYYKVQAAHDLARSLDREFDLFIRLRPDKEVVAGDLDWEGIQDASGRDRCVFCDYGPVITPMGDLIFGDQFAAAAGDAMDVYAHTWRDARSALSSQFGYARQFAGHVNFVSNLLYHGVTAARVPGLQFGRLFDPGDLPMERLRELVETDAATGPADEVSKQFLAAFAPI